MKTRILGMLLYLLCLLGCGGKKTQKAETYPLGASGFPEWIKVAWRVSQEDTTVIVAMVNKSEKDCTLLVGKGLHTADARLPAGVPLLYLLSRP